MRCRCAVLPWIFGFGIASALGYWLAPTERVTWANYIQIKEGATESDVRSLLGSEFKPYPPSDEEGIVPSMRPLIARCAVWSGRKGFIRVGFDGDGSVRWKVYLEDFAASE